MSGLPWISRPIIYLVHSTWYMLGRHVMREMEKGRERKKSGGGNKAFMDSTGYDSRTFSIPKGKGRLIVAHKVDKHPSKKITIK